MSGFLNPHLLWGLLLLGAPIIIHLLNKRRFEVHHWAAMDFLLRADVRNRRRIKLEDLILLALRIGAIGAAVFLVARPVVEGLGGKQEGERTVVIDDSFSMEHRPGGASALEKAREAAAQEIQEAIASGARLTVRRGTRPREAIGELTSPVKGGETLPSSGTKSSEEEAQGDDSAAGRGVRLLSAVRSLEAMDASLDLAGAIDREVKRLEEDRSEVLKSLTLVSDFRRSDWFDAAGVLKPRLAEAFARLKKAGGDRMRLRFINVGGSAGENTTVARVAPEAAQPIAGVPISIAVEVRNFGPAERRGLAGDLEVGDPANPTHRIPLPAFPPVPPGGSATVVIDHVFPTAGEFPLAARIDEDRLARDDRAFAVALVRDSLSALVVDGDPGPDRLGGESGFLAAALSPRGGYPTGIRPEVATQPIGEAQLKGRDVVFLLNCPEMSAAERGALDRFVREGGGVTFFLGNRVQAERYREVFGEGGLFPASLKAPLEVAGGVRIDFGSLEHPALKVYRGLRDTSLERVTAARYFGLTAAEGAQAVATYADADRTPAVIERTLDAALNSGRTAIFNLSADRDWTDWPTDPSYPVVLQEWVRHSAPRRSESRSLRCADPLVWTPEKETATPTAVDPMGNEHEAVLGGETARFEGTYRAGLYRTGFLGAAAEKRRWYAANRSVDESDLAPAAEGDLRRAFAETGLRISFAGTEAAADPEKREGDIWRWLALSALLILLAELGAAFWFGRRG